MPMPRFAAAALLASSLAAVCSSASADTLLYTFGPTYPNQPTHTFSFELPSAPTPDQVIVFNSFTEHDFGVKSVPVVADGVPGTYLIVFTDNPIGGGGGLVIAPYLYGTGEPTFSYFNYANVPLYSGEPFAPTFLTGSFPLQEFGAPYGGALGTLTVTDVTTATPEPGSFALFGTGLLGLVGVLRRCWLPGSGNAPAAGGR